MLILRYFYWVIMAHITTRKQLGSWEFLTTFLMIPVWMFGAYMNLAERTQEELVQTSVLFVSQGWRDNTILHPSPWAKKGFLAIIGVS